MSADAHPRRATRSPRTGRRPGESDTREAILDAARSAFATGGYAQTSLRGIARQAGVDPALIVHFFGSKAGLFGAVVQWPYDPDEQVADVLAGGLEQVGERLARSFIAHWERTEARSPILSLHYAAFNDPTASALLREFVTIRFTLPLMQRIGVDNADLRADLVASLLGGFGIGRYVFDYSFADAPAEKLVAALGSVLQHVVTAPLFDLEPRAGHGAG